MSATYWRSQRQIDGDPEFRTLQEREFPEGASEPPDGITRRDLMTLIGASLSLAGLSACRRPVEHIVPYVTPPEEIIPVSDDAVEPGNRRRGSAVALGRGGGSGLSKHSGS